MTRGDIPEENFTPFFVPEGTTIAFYIYVSEGGNLALQRESTVEFGDENTADDAISLKYGLRVNGSFGDSTSADPYALKGRIRYKLCDNDPPSTDDLVVNGQIPMSVILNLSVDEIPTDAAGLRSFAEPIKQTLIDISRGSDVIINSINGVPLVTKASIDGIIVDFDVVLEIVCSGGDCTSALESATDLTNNVVTQVSTSMSDGSFLSELISSATEYGIDTLTTATVDASSFSSGEPAFGVATASPSDAPSVQEQLSMFEALIQLIIDFLSGLLELLQGSKFVLNR